MIFIYIPCANRHEAKKISRRLIEERLIVCANLFPIESMYFLMPTSSQVVNNQEVVILAKTKQTKYKKIEKLVKDEHSYDIPLIASWKMDNINVDYLKWMEKGLRKPKKK